MKTFRIERCNEHRDICYIEAESYEEVQKIFDKDFYLSDYDWEDEPISEDMISKIYCTEVEYNEDYDLYDEVDNSKVLFDCYK